MLDTEPGLFLPHDYRITTYLPETKRDALLAMVQRGDYDDYVALGDREHVSFTNDCAVKYDAPQFLRLVSTRVVSLIIQMRSLKCLEHVLVYYSWSSGYFWQYYDVDKDGNLSKEMFDISIRYGIHLDTDWLRTRSLKGLNGDSASEYALEKVIEWLPTSALLDNIHILDPYAGIVVKYHDLLPLVREGLADMRETVDRFIFRVSRSMENGDEWLRDMVKRALEDKSTYEKVETLITTKHLRYQLIQSFSLYGYAFEILGVNVMSRTYTRL